MDNGEFINFSILTILNPLEVLLPLIIITLFDGRRLYSSITSIGIFIPPELPTFDHPNTFFPSLTSCGISSHQMNFYN